MPDEFLVSGEALVRNLAIGYRLAKSYGGSMPVGYLPDLFGHVAQMPQILRLLGLDNAILWRGFGGTRAEYWWEAPDGSSVQLMHLPPEGYCNATRVAFNGEEMVARAMRAVDYEHERTVSGQVLLMNGVDHVEPHPAIPQLVDRLSQNDGVRARHSTLPAYVDGVRQRVTREDAPPLETIAGELRGGEDYTNLLPGVLSARVYLKQANARIQTDLERDAEPLSTFAWLAGHPYPRGELRYAWRTLIQNQPHDSICGCSIDAVHEENMSRFARAEQVAEALAERAATRLSDLVAPAQEDVLRLVVFNTDAQVRSGVVETTIDLPYASAEGPSVSTPGAQCPGVHRFHIGIAPRSIPPGAAALFAASRAFVLPLRSQLAGSDAGRGPRSQSFITVTSEPRGIVLSALTKAEDRDAVIVRVFNPEAATARVKVALTKGLSSAFVVDLLERRQEELAVIDGAATFDVAPAQIKTIELTPVTV